jgi:hypothetical protein
MEKGVQNPLWIVASGTMLAYPAFLPSLATVRHFDPNGFKARDVRIGYGAAIGYSLFLAMVVASDTDPSRAFAAWIATSMLVLGLYELALHSSEDIRDDV